VGSKEVPVQKRLQEAEQALQQLLRERPNGVSMDEILRNFRGILEEPELRAAVWKLVAEDQAEIRDERLRELAVAA
jgi:hypothetical protein